MNKNFRAHMALLAAQVLYAASFPIAKIVMENIPDPALVLLRVSGAVILFWTASFFLRKRSHSSQILDSAPFDGREKVEKKDLKRRPIDMITV